MFRVGRALRHCSQTVSKDYASKSTCHTDEENPLQDRMFANGYGGENLQEKGRVDILFLQQNMHTEKTTS